jgi:hypothetical protein
MLGSAMETTVASSVLMPDARIVANRTHRPVRLPKRMLPTWCTASSGPPAGTAAWALTLLPGRSPAR